jgi:HEAT repeat protein
MFALGTVLLIVLAGSATSADPKGVTLGSRVFTLRLESTLQDERFVNVAWDGPTGEFTSGRILGLQLPWGVLKFTITRDPIGAIQRRLPSSVPALTKLLDSKNRLEAQCAAEALGAKKEAALSALPILLALSERNGDFFSAIESISLAAPEPAVPILLPALSSTNTYLVQFCAALFGEMGAKASAAVPALLRAFETTPRNHPSIAIALWKITGDCSTTLPSLRLTLQNDSDPAFKIHLLHILAQIGEQAAPAIPEILSVLNSGHDSYLQMSAFSALAAVGKEPDLIVPAILTFLDQPRDEEAHHFRRAARHQAISALGKFGSAGLPHLIALYKGTNNQDKVPAAKALAEIGPLAAEYLPFYMEKLNSVRAGRVALACEIIGSLGPKGEPAVPTLSELLFATEKKIKLHAATALGRLRQQQKLTIDVLASLLNESDVSLRRRTSDDELILTTLDQILASNPEMKSLLDETLKTNPAAAQYLQNRKAMQPRNGLRTYSFLLDDALPP